ncbi:MAG: hypothetical protein ACI9FD_002926 [Gammaproteobacteria bacterium]
MTEDLGESGWAESIGELGHKVLHLYRNDCGYNFSVELRIKLKEGLAQSIFGGDVETSALNDDIDCVMHATPKR